MAMYHEGNRELQDRFGARLLADRLVERLWRDRFKDEDKAFIESVSHFFLATADPGGHPDCSFKGGRGRIRGDNSNVGSIAGDSFNYYIYNI